MPIAKLVFLLLWGVLGLGTAVQLLLSSKDADTRVFWLLWVLLVPVVGVLCYCVFGINYRTEKTRQRLHAVTLERFGREMDAHQAEVLFSDKALEEVPETFRPLARLLRAAGEGNRVSGGNSFEIITSGLRKRELLLEDIRRARRFIHIEYYRFGNDKAGREVRDLLLQKVAEGVEVRLLDNNLSSWGSIPGSYFRQMQKQGMEVIPYTHIRHGLRTWLMRINFQNHRKVVVIDGEVAFTGGMNLNDNYFYRWRDTHLRLEGPAVARLQASFIDSWFSSGGQLRHPLPYYFSTEFPAVAMPFRDKLLQVVTDAPEYVQPATQLGYEWILQNARRYVYIQTPYFLPPDSFLQALKSAALRGVDVRVMLPQNVDTPAIGPANRSYYAECLAAGVRLFERSGEFIHSKTLVADDGVCIIGASNLDMRSFHINNEVNTFVYDRETAGVCREIFLADQERTREVKSVQTGLGSRFMRLLYREL